MPRRRPHRATFELRIRGLDPRDVSLSRLLVYFGEFAKLLGEQPGVHFDAVTAGSLRLRSWAEPDATAPILARLLGGAVQLPAEVISVRDRIDALMVEDRTWGSIYSSEVKGKLIDFQGFKRRSEAAIQVRGIAQAGTLIGVPIVIGGRGDTVPVHLQDGDRVFVCRASRHLAKVLAEHLFTAPVEVAGRGKWQRSARGAWELEEFTIKSIELPAAETLAEALARWRAVDAQWLKLADPVDELRRIRRGDPEEGGTKHSERRRA